jgi:hypothetical protein
VARLGAEEGADWGRNSAIDLCRMSRGSFAEKFAIVKKKRRFRRSAAGLDGRGERPVGPANSSNVCILFAWLH